MSLFQLGPIRLHSGSVSSFKIDCDALTDDDIAALAAMLYERLPSFGNVEGVPRGGLRLAAALLPYREAHSGITDDPLLIVDDVATTGASLERHRAGRPAIGAVIFARGPVPPWVTPLFSMALIQ